MEIAVTGEGKNDYGMREYGCPTWKWGPIATYIRKVADKNDVSISLTPISREDISKIKIQRSMGSGLCGHGIPARKFTILMKLKGYDKGIFYCDADRESGAENTEVQARKRFEKVYKEVEDGLNVEGINAIPMIALRMIEAWIMGDKKAIEEALDIIIPDKLYPTNPELLWGDVHDPKSNYPKNYLTRMIASCDKRYKNYSTSMDDFCNIAEATDIDTLRDTCRISFGKFCDDFDEMLGG